MILAATTIIDADFTLAARKTFFSRFDKKSNLQNAYLAVQKATHNLNSTAKTATKKSLDSSKDFSFLPCYV